jgi:hypothetical protein
MHGTTQVLQPHAAPNTHTPAVATQATKTVAAVAKFRHIAVGIFASIACAAAAQTPILVHLRDGAAGAGTILASFALAAPVNGFASIELTDLAIPGSENTAMTLEFAAAGVAGSQQTVTLLSIQRRESN